MFLERLTQVFVSAAASLRTRTVLAAKFLARLKELLENPGELAA